MCGCAGCGVWVCGVRCVGLLVWVCGCGWRGCGRVDVGVGVGVGVGAGFRCGCGFLFLFTVFFLGGGGHFWIFGFLCLSLYF